MFLNPPNQYFESILGIEPSFNWKRVAFRSSVMLILLFLAGPNILQNVRKKKTYIEQKIIASKEDLMIYFLLKCCKILSALLAESLPSFSAILQLISSVFVTCLTFVFPPLFYMRLVDRDAKKGGK